MCGVFMNDAKRNFSRHLGVYGIAFFREQLLVIKKQLGPYRNRYDLPGGRLEEWESIEEGLIRECLEETGLTITTIKPIGVTELFANWTSKAHGPETIHHIAILHEITLNSYHIPAYISQFDSQDSSEAIWLPLNKITENNASPLVLEALRWKKTTTLTTSCPTYIYLI